MAAESNTTREPEVVYALRPVGVVESSLRELRDVPRQGDEGAPEAWLVLDPSLQAATDGLHAGDRVLVLTWFHHADRSVLRTRPRNDPDRPEQGVFTTRSPDRPNPIGLHEVTVVTVDGPRVRVDRMDALHGTPVLDIKPILGALWNR